jgi:uncharacterized lipoprotein YmbA
LIRLLCCSLWFCLLTACSSTVAPAYYVLSLLGDQTPSPQVTTGPVLVVDRVLLPEYLNDLGIAFQQDDVQVVTANQARWAEALDKQLTRSLVQSLSRQLQQVQVLESDGVNDNSWHLAVDITAFQGRFDGQAIVAGRWVLRRDELIYSQSFQREIPLSEDGYPALVRALREGWQTEVKQLGQELQPTLTAK